MRLHLGTPEHTALHGTTAEHTVSPAPTTSHPVAHVGCAVTANLHVGCAATARAHVRCAATASAHVGCAAAESYRLARKQAPCRWKAVTRRVWHVQCNETERRNTERERMWGTAQVPVITAFTPGLRFGTLWRGRVPGPLKAFLGPIARKQSGSHLHDIGVIPLRRSGPTCNRVQSSV